MKKSCLIAVIATLAAVAGALAAVAVYLRRREKELDEYERLLFGEDTAAPAEEEPAEAEDEAAEEAAPAEDTAELRGPKQNKMTKGAPAVCNRAVPVRLFYICKYRKAGLPSPGEDVAQATKRGIWRTE